MGGFVVDTSVALKWFLDDEEDREYSLTILKGISADNSPVVPWLWFYEIGNALTMAVRRKRIVFAQAEEFLRLLEAMPIEIDFPDRIVVLRLPHLARQYNLTNYDAAYLEFGAPASIGASDRR
jgi:predicted nucleic acid-binding protein